jgi:hypothetical protein
MLRAGLGTMKRSIGWWLACSVVVVAACEESESPLAVADSSMQDSSMQDSSMRDSSMRDSSVQDAEANGESLAPGARCDPRGEWMLRFDFDEVDDAGAPSCNAPTAWKILQVLSTRSGALQLVGADGQLSADGCELRAEWTTRWMNRSENGSETFMVELHFDGAVATGQVQHRTEGYCPSRSTGTVVATRSTPAAE